jgi:DNA-binding MurR/RpiR family transcriptional regulator
MKATKDRIIEVAINHIKNIDQINHLTMASLAQDANIGKSTIYDKFPYESFSVLLLYKNIIELFL